MHMYIQVNNQISDKLLKGVCILLSRSGWDADRR
jgi:hypothetical protein